MTRFVWNENIESKSDLVKKCLCEGNDMKDCGGNKSKAKSRKVKDDADDFIYYCR
jgi:hypothetical protein